MAVGVAHPDAGDALAGYADAFPLAFGGFTLWLLGQGAGGEGDVREFRRGDFGEAAPAGGGGGAAIYG